MEVHAKQALGSIGTVVLMFVGSAMFSGVNQTALAMPAPIAGDCDGSGSVNAIDVQLVVNAVLGFPVPYRTDLDFSGATNALDIQLVVNAVLGIVIDSDDDGLCDAAEVRLGTRPDLFDTDDDGVGDGDEVLAGTDPLVNDQGAIQVPDVRGMNEATARWTLSSLGLVVGTVDGQYSATVAAGLVITQTPLPGERVPSGHVIDLVISLGPGGGGLPPNPVNVASPIDPSAPSDLFADTAFLYTGQAPVQTGVSPQAIARHRVAVVRGRVLNRQSQPIPGVTVRILHHPEYGHTLTREDGFFDLVVNGGGVVTIDYRKAGYLGAQRQVDAPWRDYVWAPDVVLTPPNPVATTIDFSEPMQVALGNLVSDEHGARRNVLMFPQTAKAGAPSAGGLRKSLRTLTVRITEYSSGPEGPQAMPAALPPNSGYTYCVDFSADEASRRGAKSVEFAQPVISYVENWLNAGVGWPVPLGYYDADRGLWVASESGRVVKILSEEGGLAVLDVAGNGQPASESTLIAMGISEAERQRLAELYEPGQSLWRMPIPHFSAWDANWPFGPPSDAEWPNTRYLDDTADSKAQDIPCPQEGSIIEVLRQSLGEEVNVTGTPFTLHYASDRVPGYRAPYVLDIPLTGSAVPESLIGVKLEIQIAGKQEAYSISRDRPCLHQSPRLAAQTKSSGTGGALSSLTRQKNLVGDITNQHYTFTWDGLDAYAREVSGRQPVTVRIGYEYCGQYQQTGRFGYNGGGNIEGSRTRETVTLWKEWRGYLGNLWTAQARHLGGWSLSVHHMYDRERRVLYLGDGRQQPADLLSYVIDTFAGNGDSWPPPGQYWMYPSGSLSALEAGIESPYSVDSGPDGSLYVSQYSRFSGVGYCLLKIDTQGKVHVLATERSFISDVAAADDGSVFFRDNDTSGNARITRVAPDGTLTLVAGKPAPPYGSSGDGGPALEATLSFDSGFWEMPLAWGPDGSIYVGDGDRVRRITPDGIIDHFAGGYSSYTGGGDGGPAANAGMYKPHSIKVGVDGTVYILEASGLRRIGTDGIIHTDAKVAYYTGDDSGDGGPASDARIGLGSLGISRDGTLFISEPATLNHVRRIDPYGTIDTVAGTGESGHSGDGGFATQAAFSDPKRIAVGPDGNIYFATPYANRIRRLSIGLPGLGDGDVAVASEDGMEVYIFDIRGRHMRTQDAMTGATIYQFAYDNHGRLSAVTDRSGLTTTIERDGSGQARALVSPHGQRTTLNVDAQGFLESIVNPAGDTVSMVNSPKGLMGAFTDSNGGVHLFSYDALGRLTLDQDPEGGWKSLTRADLGNGVEITLTTAGGQHAVYRMERAESGDLRITTSACCGAQGEAVHGRDGKFHAVLADGLVIDITPGADPRWGIQAPIVKQARVATPGGRSAEMTGAMVATLSDPTDRLSLSTLTETRTLNGRTFTSHYDAATRTWTETTPVGRRRITQVDEWNRIVRQQLEGLHATTFAYDSQGRLVEMVAGASKNGQGRAVTFTYGDDGELSGMMDPIGRTTLYSRDAAGRILDQSLPDGGHIYFDYNANGNQTSVTPPARTAHGFGYTAVNRPAWYEPPTAGAGSWATHFVYDLDHRLLQTERPDGNTTQFTYDGVGRLGEIIDALGTMSFTYDHPANRLATASGPNGQLVTFTYDGPFVLTQTFGGPVAGTIEYTYNNDLRLASESVNGAYSVAFVYDGDGLITGAGTLSASYSALNGLLESTSLGAIGDARGYNDFGELTNYAASFGGSPLFAYSQTFDALGRIVQRAETIGGVSHTYDYQYDLSSRLASVFRDGAPYASYLYDANGNRLRATVQGVVADATYDAQDRLLTHGGIAYTHTRNGERLTRASEGQTTTYTYDTRGNLRLVRRPSGQEIGYLVDAFGRRLGKQVNGVLTKAWLYSSQLTPVAELDDTGQVVARFVYATRTHVPDYMVKSGVTYRLITDSLGSVRVVADTQSGAVAQRIDYDPFGNVVQDTSPGFQPFGFAGGLYDPDTGLVRFGVRDYDPETGRWTAKEPLIFHGGDTNLYAYVSNDPVNRADPSGLSEWFEDCVEFTVPHLNSRWWFPLGPDHPKSKVDQVFSVLFIPLFTGPASLVCMVGHKGEQLYYMSAGPSIKNGLGKFAKALKGPQPTGQRGVALPPQTVPDYFTEESRPEPWM